jgi:CarboxypepD_reg-like domain
MIAIKKSFFFLLLLLFCAKPAQAIEVLERKIAVNFNQILLKDALIEVAEKGHFEWSYNANIIDGNKKITLKVADWTVRETLLVLLGEEYQLKSNGNYLIIKKVKKKSKELSGYIKDPKTGKRVEGVTIFDKKTLRATTTDSNGYYSLKVKKNAEVVVAKLNFKDTILLVTPQTPRFVKLNLEEIPIDTSNPDPDFELKMQRMGFALNRFFNASLDKWHSLNLRDSLERNWQLSLVPIVGTNHTLSSKVANDFSVNIVAGYSRGVEKFEVAGLGNFTRKYTKGVQIGGVFNLNNGINHGLQIAGAYNHAAILSGIQVAGAVNYTKNSNIGKGQVAGAINYTEKGKIGFQIAGFINKGDSIQALQIAGFINSADNVKGTQIAGFANHANKVKGLQIAGLVNHATKVRGVQIAIFNSAKECDCLQIGLLNRSGKRWLPIFNW